MSYRESLETRLAEAKAELSALREAYSRAVQSGQSWATRDGDTSRQVQNYNIADLAAQVAAKEREVANLEARVSGSGSSGAFRIGAIF